MASASKMASQERQIAAAAAGPARVRPAAGPMLLIGGWSGVVGALLALRTE